MGGGGGEGGRMEKWDSVLQCENRCRGFRVVSSLLAWKDVLIYGSDVKSRGSSLERRHCRGGGSVTTIFRLLADRTQMVADALSAGKSTFPNVPLCGHKWISAFEFKGGSEETTFQCSQQPPQWKPAQQVGKLQVIAEAVESSLVLVESLKKNKALIAEKTRGRELRGPVAKS